MQGSKSGTAMALFAALGVGLGAAEAAAQQVVGCDAGSNGYVSADEAAMCAERDYSTSDGRGDSDGNRSSGESAASGASGDNGSSADEGSNGGSGSSASGSGGGSGG
jgi:hypothetical protein